MSQLDATLTRVPLTLTVDLEFSRSNCISRMGGPIVMERKGREPIGCPDVKHYGNESTGCCTDWGTFDLEFLRSNCISGMGGPIVMERKGLESIGCPDVKHYGNESTGCCADWGTFDLEFSKSNCILGMGGPIVMEQKGRELIACPDVKDYGNESTGCCADWSTFDLDLWPWIFKVKLYLGNGRPHCHGTKGTGVDNMPWCETLRKWVNWMLRWLEYLWSWPLTLNFQGQIVSREWEAPLSWNERDGSW